MCLIASCTPDTWRTANVGPRYSEVQSDSTAAEAYSEAPGTEEIAARVEGSHRRDTFFSIKAAATFGQSVDKRDS
jgi:dihydroorotate dehydrogenase